MLRGVQVSPAGFSFGSALSGCPMFSTSLRGTISKIIRSTECICLLFSAGKFIAFERGELSHSRKRAWQIRERVSRLRVLHSTHFLNGNPFGPMHDFQQTFDWHEY